MGKATLSKLAIGALALGLGTSGALGQSTTDWAGFYAGIYGGYALDSAGASSSSIGPATLDLGGGDVLSGTLDSSNGRISGLFGGAAAGYNYQREQLVLGVELGGGLGGFGKTNSTVAALSMTDGVNTATIDYSDVTTFGLDWYTTLQGRVGFAQDNWMFYLKGGAALANVTITNNSRVTLADPGGLIGLPNIDLPSSGSTTQLIVGPTFGVGIEAMVTDAVSVSAEYSYLNLPSAIGPSSLLGGLLGGGGSTFDAATHQLKAGVNYHF
ncbi:outer membrane protein [Devosia ginsengisoli]|uniref:outer membrane protein n=1 Tax=Devosia ginsengisoli TaxID=400770 RepID=UPI0026ED78D8|nr:outer membrane beta-barrel protein [Devosia ginsengisoli]MCR6672238.1 outer membrane beta-barrel protein [Devosia ginsengisoli]